MLRQQSNNDLKFIDDEDDSKVIDEILIDIENQIQKISLKRVDYESKIDKYEKSRKILMGQVDPNAGYFTATGSVKYSTELNELNNEIEKCKTELPLIIEKIELLQSRKIRLQCVKKHISGIMSHSDSDNLQLSSSLSTDLYKAIRIQQDEQIEIGSRLHDSITQGLAMLIHKSELVYQLIDIDHNRAKIELASLQNSAQEILHCTKEIIYDLNPISLYDQGLSTALKNFLDLKRLHNQFQIAFDTFGSELDTDILLKTLAYRIVHDIIEGILCLPDISRISIRLEYSEVIKVSLMTNETKLFDAEKIVDKVAFFGGEMSVNVKRNGIEVVVLIPTFGWEAYKND